jgi:hypothetical protein
MNRRLLVAAAVLAAASAGAKCTSVAPIASGAARVSVVVGAEALFPDRATVRLVIDDDGEAPAFSARTVLLDAAPAGRAWSANVTDLPASTTGSVRHFKAEAFDGLPDQGKRLYAGDVLATIVAGHTAQVTIILQDVARPPGVTNHVPVILSVTATSIQARPGEPGRFAITATDPDRNGYDATHPLLFRWSARCGAGELQLAAAESTSPVPDVFGSSIAWTAPAATTGCTAAVEVRENPAVVAVPLSVTASFTLLVGPAADLGSAGVLVLPNSPPIVTVAADFQVAEPSSGGGPRGDLDPDGDDVRFELTAKCGADLTAAAAGPDIASTYFSAVTYATTGGLGVRGTSVLADWTPTFGIPRRSRRTRARPTTASSAWTSTICVREATAARPAPRARCRTAPKRSWRSAARA